MGNKIKLTTVLLLIKTLNIFSGNLIVGDYNGSFNVSQSGSALYNIPIECPKGVNGMEPTVSLNYNSQNGMGIAGHGWSLSATSIISKDIASPYYDGKILPINHDNSADYLTLDGQRLIKYAKINDTETEFRTECDNYNRIIRKGKSGNFYFEIYLTNGRKRTYKQLTEGSNYYYGNLGWYLTQEEDLYGNYISYNYSVTSNNGNISNVLLSTIQYGGNNKNSNAHTCKIQFYYDASLSTPMDYAVGGYTKSNYKILSEIRTHAASNVLNNKYVLSYSVDQQSRKILQKIKKYGNNGDYLDDLVISWFNTPESLKETTQSNANFNDNSYTNKQWFSCDYNNDGYADLLSLGYKSTTAYLQYFKNQPNAQNNTQVFNLEKTTEIGKVTSNIIRGGVLTGLFTSRNTPNIILPCLTENKKIIKLFNAKNISDYYTIPLKTTHTEIPPYSCADLNKDGYTDIVIIEKNIFNSTYYGKILWGGECPNLKKFDLYNSSSEFTFSCDGTIQRMSLSDMNGDGLLDIIIVSDKGYSVLKNKGNQNSFSNCGFSGDVSVYKTGMYYKPSEGNIFECGDFNGDGICDFFKGTNSKNYLYLGKSDCTFYPITISNISNCPTNSFSFAADIDDDRKTELVILRDNGKNISWYHYDGAIFSLIHSSTNNNRSVNRNNIIMGDVSSDGRIDVVSIGASLISSQTNSNTLYNAQLSSDNFGGLVNKISTPMGSFSITYSTLTDKNIYKKSLSLPENLNLMSLCTPLRVVSSVKEFEKGKTLGFSINYTYENAMVEMTGKGFLGFMKTIVFDERNNVTTTTENTYNVMPAFLSPSSITKSISSNIFQKTEYNNRYISTCSNNTKAYFPYMWKTIVSDKLNGTSQTTTYSSYKYQNPTSITQDFGDGIKKVVTYSDLQPSGNYNSFLPSTKQTIYTNKNGSSTITTKTNYNTNFNPIKIINFYGTDKAITTEYTYLTNGNLSTEKISAQNCEVQQTSYTYTSSGRFPSVIKESDGSSITYTIDETLDRLTKEVEKCGNLSFSTSYSSYDGFNNCQKKIYSDGREENINASFFTSISPSCFMIKSSLTGSPSEEKLYDAKGRIIRKKEIDSDGKYRMLFYGYDNMGKIEYEASRSLGDTPDGKYYAQYEYDKYGRLTKLTNPDRVTKYTYEPLKRNITSNLSSIVENYNAAGQLLSKSENGKTVSFTYTPSGLIASSTAQSSSGNLTTSMKYDIAGNRISINDPDVGTITTEYDAYGRKILTTTENNVDITYSYDSKGRLTEQSDGQTKTLYSYNSNNQLTNESYDKYSCSYTYDESNRITQKKEVINGTSFNTLFSYGNKYGDVSSITYPSGLVVNHAYDNYGHLINVTCKGTSIWKPTKLDVQGRIVEETLSGNVIQTYQYDTKDHLTTEKAYKGTIGLKDLTYTYTNEMITKKSDLLSSNSEEYAYDKENRLADVTTLKGNRTSGGYCTYDEQGNLKSPSEAIWRAINYGENGLPPHQVSSVSYYVSSYSTKPVMTFDSYRMMKSIKEGDYSYSIDYKPNHRKCRSLTYKSNVLQQTHYYLENYEKVVSKDGNLREIHYLCGGNGLAAIYVKTDGKDTLFTAVTDRQNSLTAIMNTANNEVETFAYKPWGMRRKNNNWTTNTTSDASARFSRGYCMHEHLSAFGLIDMGGRMYSTRLCQFVTPDPQVQDPGCWRNLNRFSYCLQNPIMYTDPSGESIDGFYTDALFNYCQSLANLNNLTVPYGQVIVTPTYQSNVTPNMLGNYTPNFSVTDFSADINKINQDIQNSVNQAITSAMNTVNEVQNTINNVQNTLNSINEAQNSLNNVQNMLNDQQVGTAQESVYKANTLMMGLSHVSNGVGGTSPALSNGGSIGYSSNLGVKFYEPKASFNGNGFYGNQYIKTYQLKELAPIAKWTGRIGTVVVSGYNIYNGYTQDGYQIGENTGRAVVKSSFSWAGATLGGRIGIRVGSYFPPYGPFIGGAIGGVAGGFFGDVAVDYIYDLTR